MFCTEPAHLLAVVLANRGLSPEAVDVHVGIDGGQGWLKLGLSVTDKTEVNNNGRAHYSEVFLINLKNDWTLHKLTYMK